jgi:PhnB protein
MSVKPVPEGYHSITPYLIIRGASRAIDYYKEAFGAVEMFRMEHEGKVGHAELKMGDSVVMLADEHPETGQLGPESVGGSPVTIMLYVDAVDEVFPRAIESGGTELRPVEDQFYGDRSGNLRDPFGHVWVIATHVEDVSPEEMERRMAEESRETGDGSRE